MLKKDSIALIDCQLQLQKFNLQNYVNTIELVIQWKTNIWSAANFNKTCDLSTMFLYSPMIVGILQVAVISLYYGEVNEQLECYFHGIRL